jgi:hypothetical protein
VLCKKNHASPLINFISIFNELPTGILAKRVPSSGN